MSVLLGSFSSSLLKLPALYFTDVEEIAAANSPTDKRVKGYKFFHEEYIPIKPVVSHIVQGQAFIRAGCFRSMKKNEEPHKLQGKHPEPVSEVVVRKPKTMGKRYLHYTLYRAYTGPLPDPDILASGEKLRQLEPQPLIALVLDGLSNLELVPSKSGPVPQG